MYSSGNGKILNDEEEINERLVTYAIVLRAATNKDKKRNEDDVYIYRFG